MATQVVRKVYTDIASSATLVIPAGITNVKVFCEYPAAGLDDLSIPLNEIGWNSSFMLDQQQRLWAWGDNGNAAENVNGILGINTSGGASSIPQLINVIQKWRQFYSSNAGGQLATTCFALDTEGGLWTWGNNTDGILGINQTQAGVAVASSPQLVFGPQRWQRMLPSGGVAGANTQVVALDTLGQLWCWGNNTFGQNGTNDVVHHSTATLVVGGKTNWVFANAQCTHTLALDLAGAAYAWGNNANGQLGIGTVASQSSPVAVLGSHVFTKIYTTPGKTAATASSSYGIDSAGAVWAWGNNVSGELGVGDVTPRSSPVAVVGGLVVTKLVTTSNNGTILALTPTGQVYGWGNNADGQLGNGDVTVRSSPTLVLGGITFTNIWLRISSGNNTSAFGLDSSGQLWGWGFNGVGNGVLGGGNGLTAAFSSPQIIVGGNKWSFILPSTKPQNGTGQILGIDVNGKMWAWGSNLYGECGQNNTTPSYFSSPVAVIGGPHNWNISPPPLSYSLDVTPGSSYVVIVSGQASFGGKPLGFGYKKVTVEYQQ